MSIFKIKVNKQLVYIVLISCFLEVAIAPLRGYVSLMSNAVAGFAVYFIFTIIVIKKFANTFKPVYLLLAVILGCSIFPVPVHIFYLNSTLRTLPDYIMHIGGISVGYWFVLSRSHYLKATIVILSIILCLFVYIKGYSMWIHKLNYGTFTGLVEHTHHTANVAFQTNNGDTVQLSDFKGKYLLLDCWYTYCGSCYKKFPQVQEFYDKYKDNPELAIYAVHSRVVAATRKKGQESVRTGSDILKKEGYTFPCLSIDIDNPVLKELGVIYPVVLIFNRESNLVFRGDIENASKYISNILEKQP
jgi:thiol-disulfide isomerase/thioredoxin